jgi:enamine deaminase RidA (YjgF/YER057c/UK114 family)
MPTTIEYASQAISAEQELATHLPVPPEPFGTYSEAVQAGSLLFLSGTLPTEGRTAKFVGRVGAELDVAAGREAARLAAINALAIARQHLGSLDRVKRIFGSASARRRKEMSATCRRSLTERLTSSRACLAQTKILRAWCMEPRVFHLEPCQGGAHI